MAGQGGPGGTAGGARAAAGVVRRHVWISGRVQGVWFRESCRRRAAELGVGGWIRNRADGRVEAVVRRSRSRQRARRGPRSRVSKWSMSAPSEKRISSSSSTRGG